MSSNPKKYHLLIFLGFVACAFIVADAARSIYDVEFLPFSVPKPIFDAMKLISIVFSIITFVIPGPLYKGVSPFRLSEIRTLNQITPTYRVLILGYIFIFCPVINGLILYFFGMPLVTFYYYVGASLTGTLIWGFMNFKNPFGRGPT